MQILNQSTGDTSHVGRTIAVTVVEICGDRVKLGFDCPAQTPVYFEEIYLRIRAAREAADASRRLGELLRQADCPARRRPSDRVTQVANRIEVHYAPNELRNEAE